MLVSHALAKTPVRSRRQMAYSDTVFSRQPLDNLGEGQRQGLTLRTWHEAHVRREIAVVPRPEDQVPVIGHETVGENTHCYTFLHFTQYTFEGSVVFVLLENGQTRVGAVDDMIDQTAGGGG